MTYTIGEMAKILGTSTSALRYYDKEGVIPFVERSEGDSVFSKKKTFPGSGLLNA